MGIVNGIQVGRAESTRLVAIDSGKLSGELEKRGLSKADASRKLMRSKSYFNNILWQNGATKVAIEQIESVLGIPPETYLLETAEDPETEINSAPDAPELPADRSGVERQLSRIADALEVLASVPAVSITRVERCTILLKQMLCYGVCLFNDYENKAKSYGFTAEEIKESVRLAGASKELKNGKDMYLRRNK